LRHGESFFPQDRGGFGNPRLAFARQGDATRVRAGINLREQSTLARQISIFSDFFDFGALFLSLGSAKVELGVWALGVDRSKAQVLNRAAFVRCSADRR
jgi:hypothetical protein